MSEFRVNSITNQDGSAGPQVCGVSTFSGKSGVHIPSGPTDFRRQDGGGRGRGVFCGGESPKVNSLERVEIATTGNAVDFGDLTEVKSNASATGNSTRAVVFGGETPSVSSKIDFFVFSSGGGANDFGDMVEARRGASSNASGNEIRGITAGGNPGSSPNTSDLIEFVTLATTGDATSFGDLLSKDTYLAALASPTRIIWGGGVPRYTKEIQFATIATLGNTTKFGELTQARGSFGGTSSETRGIFMGGKTPSGDLDTIDFITIASEGNATDFGNLLASNDNGTSCSNSVRALYAGGNGGNVIQFVTISTTGNATDFGDLISGRNYFCSASDAHGGLAQ